MAAVTLRSGVASTTNNGNLVSASFTPTAGELLYVVAIFSGRATTTTATASANSMTFTSVGSALKNASADILQGWVSDQLVPASPAAMTVTAVSAASTGGIIFVFSVSGVTKTGLTAIKQVWSAANGAAAQTPVAFGNSSLAGNPLIGVVGNSASPATLTPPTGWTETATIGDIGYATPTSGGEAAFLSAGAVQSTFIWGSASATVWGVLGVEVDASSVPVAPKPIYVAGGGARNQAVHNTARGRFAQ